MTDKLTKGNIGFRYPSTKQRESQTGAMVQLYNDTPEPHVKIQPVNGLEYIFDQDKVGDAGKPEIRSGKAIVKQIYPDIEVALRHKEWPVKEITNGGWALAQDPWNGNWHWLPPRTEGGDHEYRLDTPYTVAMQGLVLDDGSPAPQPGPGLGR